MESLTKHVLHNNIRSTIIPESSFLHSSVQPKDSIQSTAVIPVARVRAGRHHLFSNHSSPRHERAIQHAGYVRPLSLVPSVVQLFAARAGSGIALPRARISNPFRRLTVFAQRNHSPNLALGTPKHFPAQLYLAMATVPAQRPTLDSVCQRSQPATTLPVRTSTCLERKLE